VRIGNVKNLNRKVAKAAKDLNCERLQSVVVVCSAPFANFLLSPFPALEFVSIRVHSCFNLS